jgi:Putative auto-transporter adhesin, head GIN domain
MYPNGRMPTSVPTMSAKPHQSQVLTKNNGPAAMSLKNASMIDHLTFPFITRPCGQLSVTGIKAARLTVTVSGSGPLYGAGTAARLDVTLSGDGLAQLSQLTASEVHAIVTGSGLIQVTATTSLDAAVPGTGAIVCSGNPRQVTSSITGVGTVTSG